MLKPMDIHNADFKRTFKGYNPEEVDDFLATIVSKYETVYHENRRLEEELAKAHAKLEERENKDKDVRDLISLTKESVQEIKSFAKEEADKIVQSANEKANIIIAEAQGKAERMLTDTEIRLARTRQAEIELRDRIRLNMETIWNLLTNDEPNILEETRQYRAVDPILNLADLEAVAPELAEEKDFSKEESLEEEVES